MEDMEGQTMKHSRDVIIEILKRLPAKSLMRFKCVSQTWYDLINSSDFIYVHYNHDCLSNQFILFKRYHITDENNGGSIYYNGKNLLSFHSNDDSFKYIAPNIEYDDNYIGVSIEGPCNGIVCIASYRRIILYNPSLQEIWELPNSDLHPRPLLSLSEQLISYWLSMTIGIGFDTNTTDYKVVWIFDPADEYEFEDNDNYCEGDSNVEIYSLCTNSWRKLEELKFKVVRDHCFHVLFNGAYHWRGFNLSQGYDYSWIVSFNFSTELFTCILFPEGLGITAAKSLVVMNESLALISYRTFYIEAVVMPQSIDIWVMKKYAIRDSWIKECTIGPLIIVTPLSFWRNDTELMIESSDGKLASCNIFKEEIKEFDMSGVRNTLEVIVCKDSLVSIKRERKRLS